MPFVQSFRLTDDIVLCKERAVYLEGLNTCVVSDLHIGLEEGVLGAPVDIQSDDILKRLDDLIKRYKPEQLVINGDFKHTFSSNIDEEWIGGARILEYLTGMVKVYIIRGNHDNFLSSIANRCGVELKDTFSLGGYVFAHGHRELPGRKTGEVYILGHEHPAVKLRDKVGGYVKIPVFVWRKGDFLVLPAFSSWTYGHDLSDGEVLVKSLTFDEFLDSRVIGCTDYGLLDLSRLKDLMKAGRL
ncbi:MAG: metallophosphoesterase [Candidatus Thermoplasmatota archaeon]